VVWGTYYGLLLCAWRLLRPAWERIRDRFRPAVRTLLGWLLTFHLTCVAALIFRAEVIADVPGLAARFAEPVTGRGVTPACLLVLLLGYALHLCPERGKSWCAETYRRWPAAVQGAVLAALLVLFGLLALEENPFYYFQF
jgi:hypothetical protein